MILTLCKTVFLIFTSPVPLGAWKDSMEDWAAEDWNEDVSDFMNVKIKLENLMKRCQVVTHTFPFISYLRPKCSLLLMRLAPRTTCSLDRGECFLCVISFQNRNLMYR